MRLRRDALFGTVALLSIMTLVAFGTIGLIARMSPEIHRTLKNNIASAEAAERMLAILAGAGGAPLDPAARARYEDSLAFLASNVTEPGEGPLVRSLEQRRDAATGDDPTARLVSIADLQGILEINRTALHHADQRTQQLGVAGAWSVVLMAVVAMLISYIAARRLDRLVISPIGHLHRVLEQSREGETHRRCHARGGSRAIEEIFEVVNDLLDRRLESMDVAGDASSSAFRACVVRLLDERAEPTFLVREDGELLATNRSGLEALAGEHGEALREALRSSARSGEPSRELADGVLRSERIEGGRAVLSSVS